jgi:negative regulator of flagellin synthesis FlgM
MNINEIGGNGRAQRPESHSTGANKTDSRPKSGRADGDRIELSQGAQRMAGLAEAAGQLPPIRQELVDALRESIENGSFRVNPRELARAILEFEDGLFR